MVIFGSISTTFEASIIFKAVVAIAKIGLGLKPNEVKLVQILDMHCDMCIRVLDKLTLINSNNNFSLNSKNLRQNLHINVMSWTGGPESPDTGE